MYILRGPKIGSGGHGGGRHDFEWIESQFKIGFLAEFGPAERRCRKCTFCTFPARMTSSAERKHGEMPSLVEFDRVADARERFKSVLDAAAAGAPVTVRRNQERFAVVDAGRLRYFLASIATQAQVVSEDGGWSLFFPGLPIAADGESLDEVFDDAIVVLREYAEDWVERLHSAPNHADNWGLVQLVALSSDDQLREWLVGFAPLSS